MQVNYWASWGKISKGLGTSDAFTIELDLEKEKESGVRAVQHVTFTMRMFVKCILENILKHQCDECLSGCNQFYS